MSLVASLLMSRQWFPYRDTRGSPKIRKIGMRTDVERKNGEEGGMNWEECSHTSLAEQEQAGFPGDKGWPKQTQNNSWCVEQRQRPQVTLLKSEESEIAKGPEVVNWKIWELYFSWRRAPGAWFQWNSVTRSSQQCWFLTIDGKFKLKPLQKRGQK